MFEGHESILLVPESNSVYDAGEDERSLGTHPDQTPVNKGVGLDRGGHN